MKPIFLQFDIILKNSTRIPAEAGDRGAFSSGKAALRKLTGDIGSYFSHSYSIALLDNLHKSSYLVHMPIFNCMI